MRARVLFLTQGLQIGGAQRQLTNLAVGLSRRDVDVTVVSLYPVGGPLADELVEGGVRLVALQKRGRWDIHGVLTALWREVRRFQPRIIHGYLDVPNLLCLLLRRAAPDARVVWGVRGSNLRWARYDWLTRACFALSCRMARFADLIVVNSEAGRVYHAARSYPPDRMHVVHNGIETDMMSPDPQERDRTRALWSIAPSQRVVGIVGRLDGMKDHPTFIRAAAIVARTRDDVCFVCVGAGDPAYTASLQRLAEDHGLSGRLQWLGAYSEMRGVYNALDILVSSSSDGEGFSNAVAEAMSCGVPCVVSDVGDSRLIVGDTGIVVPPRKPEMLADAITELLSRLGPALREAARERIVREFGIPRMVATTADVLEIGLRLSPPSSPRLQVHR